ncbi:UpxY family transcription antiterminator [Larkinella terrae]|uniref:UpxY family transcription antiterminator n=1 Tax=Larkinella terrae TaxID=2025311 RepID=A0A7K0EG28_9BACT|nr:UpxY family transcription antiterminator [Larkinella terrae]MRS60725.1 UpxY family transcription antiterminator [Larkinella terrae]
MAWYVLYTKSRTEKAVADRLRERGIEVYCPLIKTKRKWSDRVKLVEEPLFRSYCFVNLEEQQRSRVFAVSGIVRYLFWMNKPAVVRDSEIETIRLMLNETDNRHITVENFTSADRIKIKSGFFSDSEGHVINQQGKTLAVFIDSLQMVVKVDLSKTIVAA